MGRVSRLQPLGRLGLACLLCLASLGGLVGCAEPKPPPRPNVIVLLVDTLRAQDLGAYGFERPTSPRLDRLAEESFLFEQARAQAPCTFPSVNSILTGLPPSRFASRPNGNMGIPDGVASLPAILHAHGYATAAVSASPIVRATPSKFNPQGGFDPGFDHFDESCEWRTAACVNRRALEQIDGLTQPFFLYLHYMDPHGPYRTRKDWTNRFADPDFDGSQAARLGRPNALAKRITAGETFVAGSPERADIDHMHDLYDDEIAFFDDQLGRLLDTLDERGLLDDTILVLIADHGEQFYEHGHLKHCHTIYDTDVRTPLLIRFPPDVEPTEPRRITSPAANLDLVPTILDYLQLTPPEELPGLSLRPAIAGADDGESGDGVRQVVISEWVGMRAASDGRFKLILRGRRGKPELYDLANDPGETVNVIDDHRREARRLGRAIERWTRQEEASAKARGDKANWGEGVVDRLRALGYVQ